MTQRPRRPAAAMMMGSCLIIATACGQGVPNPTAERSIVIQLSRHDLLVDAVTVAVYFYDAAQSCMTVQAMPMRPPTAVGPYKATLTDTGRMSGMTFSLDQIPVGTYTVLVDALDADERLVATGCASDQMVKSRTTSKIRVFVGMP